MLLRDILLENKNINPNLYGGWINGKNGNYIPIADRMGHEAYIKHHIAELDNPPGGELQNIKRLATYNGYVRVVFITLPTGRKQIAISGDGKYIKNVEDIILEIMDVIGEGTIVISASSTVEQLEQGIPPENVQWKRPPEAIFQFPEEEKRVLSYIRNL